MGSVPLYAVTEARGRFTAQPSPSVFAAPNRFDIERPNAHRHVSFASGIHFCVGAHLARMECDVWDGMAEV